MSDRFCGRESLGGVILAGGRAQRMGGLDKGLVMLGNLPLAAHVRNRLGPQVDRLILNANRSILRYRQLGFEVQSDVITGNPGPLAGILTGLTFSETDWLAFSPCDTPWIPTDLVDRLWKAVAERSVKVAVAHDGERLQPLCCLVHKSLAADLDMSLQEGMRSMKAWLSRHDHAVADFCDNRSAFSNLNYRSDVENAMIGSAVDSM